MVRGTDGRRAHVGARAKLDALADEVVQVVRLMDGLNRYRFANQPESRAALGERHQHLRAGEEGGRFRGGR